MKINQIISETTTSGSVATVSQPFAGVQTRTSSKKGNNLLTGTKTNKKYANSVAEGKKDFAAKIAGKIAQSNKKKEETEKRVKQHQDQQSKDKVEEARLEEDDLIIVPGQGVKRKTGLVPHGQSRVDHEVEMARSDLFQAFKNAQKVYELIKDVSEDEGLDGWVQEKIIKANDYLNTVREYLEHRQYQQEAISTGGVIAGGGVGEGAVNEKAVSKAQQKFMGMVHAAQKGEKPASKEVAKVAKTMPKKAAKDFASTKHKGLPQHVKKD